MKFWKCLNTLIDEILPDWRDNFLSYKELKKQLKQIYPENLNNSSSTTAQNSNKRDQFEAESKEVTDFVRLLEGEIDKFNAFFVDKEEEYVIRLKELQEEATKAKESSKGLMKVVREIVDFHGEMVLLENYSALNYTGLVKILKKYDKRSGALIRLPFIQKVLEEPFYSTEILDKLVKECEIMLEKTFYSSDPSVPYNLNNEKHGCNSNKASQEINWKEGCHLHTVPTNKGNLVSNGKKMCDSKSPTEITDRLPTVSLESAENENMESMYKRTLSALRVLQEVRSGSSTVNVFSLPPLQNNEQGANWKNSQSSFQEEAK